MKKLVVATRNRGKIVELELLLQGVVETVLPIGSFPGTTEVEEDGATFRENAVKKARYAAEVTGLPALADDSGLVVDYLNGRPGVHSARFAGPGANDKSNNRKLLEELAGVPVSRRNAAFHCVLAYCTPEGECRTFDGTLEGIILEKEQGEGGFGYDPLFLIPGYGETLAQLSMEIKNNISHRAAALFQLKRHLAESDGNPLQ